MCSLQNVHLPQYYAGAFTGLFFKALQTSLLSVTVFFQPLSSEHFYSMLQKSRSTNVGVRSQNNAKFFPPAACWVCYNFLIPQCGNLFNIIFGTYSYHFFSFPLQPLFFLFSLKLIYWMQQVYYCIQMFEKRHFYAVLDLLKCFLSFRTVQVLRSCRSAILHQIWLLSQLYL